MTTPRLSELLLLFLRVGNITFGGGDPTIAALEREMVKRRPWLEPEEFGLAYSCARVTPGTNLLAFCAAAGWYVRGWRGAVIGVLAVTLPSAVVAIWLTWAYEAFKDNALAVGAISGLLASALGMMAAAAWHLLRPMLALRKQRVRACAFAIAAAALLSLGLPPVPVLAAAALAGALWSGPRA